jgi:hypothetical protein
MKTISTFVTSLTLGVTALAASPPDLVVHEWGTFTSVQGGDGKLLAWQAQQVGDLPRFVYNWFNPGLNRETPPSLLFGKGGITSLQRMETPVIYFYSDRELNADVEVRFPSGTITEWFPQAAQIGACQPKTNTPANLAKSSAKESLVRWRNVRVKPNDATALKQMQTDTNGTHYFAARETDAAMLKVNNLAVTNAADEHEKFLFYRGSGNFATPLVVTTSSDGTVAVQNTGAKPLAHLFLLHVDNDGVEWAHLNRLAPKAKQRWRRLNTVPAENRVPLADFQKQIAAAMTVALKGEGLFPAEARSMVNTWSQSWFMESGVRVLYILPRDWADEILPLKISPQPLQTVRVMIGRAEVITPDLQSEIAALMKLHEAGNEPAGAKLQSHWKKLGRFAAPAARLAMQSNERENKRVASAKFE